MHGPRDSELPGAAVTPEVVPELHKEHTLSFLQFVAVFFPHIFSPCFMVAQWPSTNNTDTAHYRVLALFFLQSQSH